MPPPSERRTIRLLAIDIDGTLAVGNNRVSPANRRAITRALAADIHVVLATGRRHRTARAVAHALGAELPLVCLGGALVKDGGDRTLSDSRIEPELVGTLVALARAQDQAVVLQVDAGVNTGDPDFLIDSAVKWSPDVRRYHAAHAAHAGTFDTASPLAASVLVVSLFGPTAAMARLAAAVTAHHPQLATVLVGDTKGGGSYLEIANARVDKWTGLSMLAARLEVPGSAIAAIGDELNDLPMLRNAGVGIAMGNGHPDVQAAADWITETHADDGVAHAINRLLAAR